MMIRKSRWDNQFYPADSGEVKGMWEEFFAACKTPKITESIRAIQVPHAGWVYSGRCAAEAYNQLKNRDIKTIVMIGPQHHIAVRSMQIYPEGEWHSPVGNLEVDSQMAQRFLEFEPAFQVDIRAHEAEHSLEVQIAPLKLVLPDAKIVPILMAPYRSDHPKILAEALAGIVDESEDTVVLVSTDLYHGESYDECEESDANTISYVSKLDAEGLERALGSGEASACGGDGLVGLLGAAGRLGIKKAELLTAYNSNDIMGRRGGYVVGYAACAFTGG